jgi:hypothetical protein
MRDHADTLAAFAPRRTRGLPGRDPWSFTL